MMRGLAIAIAVTLGAGCSDSAGQANVESKAQVTPRDDAGSASPQERREDLRKRGIAHARALGLPATLDEALAANPALASELDERGEQARFNLAYKLELRAGVEVCLGDQVPAAGVVYGLLPFDTDPEKRKAIGRSGFDQRGSSFTPETSAVIVRCIEELHVRSLLPTAERRGGRGSYYTAFGVRFPIRDDNVYRIVRAGSFDIPFEP